MDRFTIGQAATLLGVSPDTVRRWVDAGRLPATRPDGGRRMIDGPDLAAFARAAALDEGSQDPSVSSARNRFDGIVTAVVRDAVMAQVEMVAGPHRIVSLMSREAADELALAPGVRATASVKATVVVIERPSS